MILKSCSLKIEPGLPISTLTLFPMAGGRCVSRQFKIDSIQAGMKFSGLQLNDNSFLSIL